MNTPRIPQDIEDLELEQHFADQMAYLAQESALGAATATEHELHGLGLETAVAMRLALR